MRITTWNARGLNAPSKKRIIKQYLNKFESEIILLQETKLSIDEGIKLNKTLGIQQSIYQAANGSAGGLGVIWNPKKVDIVWLEQGTNWISVTVQSLKSDLKFILVNTYEPNNLSGKQQVWDEMSSLFLKFKEFRIVIGGDFNSIPN